MSNLFEPALDVGEPKRLLSIGDGAARELGLSQPARAQHMTALEKDFGVPLFDRTPCGIRLITAGKFGRICAMETAASVTGPPEDLAKAFGLGGCNVRLSGFPSFVVGPLAAALGNFESATGTGSGDVHHHSYEVAEAEPPESMTLLDDGEIDLAFVFLHEDEDAPMLPGHHSVDLGADHLDLIVHERWNRAGQITHLKDVADLPWIMGCVRCRSTAARLCRRAGFEPRTRHVIDNPGAIQSLVSNGLGVALLPRSARRYSQVAGIDSIVLDEAGARRVIAMVSEGLRYASEVEGLLIALRAVSPTTVAPRAAAVAAAPQGDDA